MRGFRRYIAVPNRLDTWVRLVISDFPMRIAKRLPAGNHWRMLRNPNYRNSPGVSRLRCRKYPIIAILSRPTVRPKIWRTARSETPIIPKAQNRANRRKIVHFRIFSCIFSPAENRAENTRFCGGFAGFSRKMRGFERYVAVPNATGAYGQNRKSLIFPYVHREIAARRGTLIFPKLKNHTNRTFFAQITLFSARFVIY